MKSLKILHLPNPVGGNSYGLSRGERLLGLQSDVLVAKASWLDYPADINLHLDKLSNNPAKFLRLINTFLKIRNKYDIFHFNFGSTLFHDFKNRLCLAEIPFYPRKTRLFATYNGCDARQKYPTVDRTKYSACKDENCYQGICNSGELDKFKKKSIQKMSRYVKHIWAVNPDLLYYLPQEKSSFLPYTVAYNCDTITPPNIKKRLKILHAPTNRAAKGSDIIISTLSKLSDKYKGSIEVIMVENLPHSKALELYKEADLIIDQLLVGWYGGVAVELMQMGKPVMARISKEDLHFIPRQMAKDVLDTVINVDPETIYERCADIIENPGLLKIHAEASIAYVRKWHNPQYVAGITKQYYEMN